MAPSPYLPLWGAGYFGLLTALSLLFPSFPSRPFARSGLTASLLLAFVMTYQASSALCVPCLFAHGCNILIWGIWTFTPASVSRENHATLGPRLCIALFAPISVVGLFAALNLTFVAYNRAPEKGEVGLKAGEALPAFAATTVSGKKIASTDAGSVVLNFVAPGCPYCREQLELLQTVKGLRIINISPSLSEELVQLLLDAEWIEDSDRLLGQHFNIGGYPTLYKVEDGKISRVVHGAQDTLLKELAF